MPLPISFPKCRGSAKHRYLLSFSPMAAGCRKSQKSAANNFRMIISICSSMRPDAAIVMTTLLRAAEAVGLGCCPISVIRDHAATISEMFALPEKVIPIAGMCVGWPAEKGGITPRLSLKTTVHEERFTENFSEVEAYDQRRAATRPYRNQREPERFGRSEFYGWSEDKARQYAVPLRADFGAFVRAKGFK